MLPSLSLVLHQLVIWICHVSGQPDVKSSFQKSRFMFFHQHSFRPDIWDVTGEDFFQSWDFSTDCIQSFSKPRWKPAMFQVMGWPWDSKIIMHNHPHFSSSILFMAFILSWLQWWTAGQQPLCDKSSFSSFVHKSPSLDDPQGQIYWDAAQYSDAWGHLEGSPDLWNQTWL